MNFICLQWLMCLSLASRHLIGILSHVRPCAFSCAVKGCNFLQKILCISCSVFSMGVEELQVFLDAPPSHIFRPGDVVSGIVKMVASTDVDLEEGITITLFGNATVIWVEGMGGSTTYFDSENLFETSFVQSCTHSQIMYPFAVRIPDIPWLPWTVKTNHGRVEYGVKAVFRRPWFKFGVKQTTVPFKLNSYLNARIAAVFSRNVEYYANAVSAKSGDYNVGRTCIPFCCCSSKEIVTMMMATDALWKYPGSEILFSLDVDNTRSGRRLDKGMVQLVGVWRQKGSSYRDGSTKEKTQDIILHDEAMEINVAPGEHVILKGVIKVPLDAMPMPTQPECSILTLTYKLRAVVGESARFGCMKPATVEVDVVIGTLGVEEILNDDKSKHNWIESNSS